MKIDDGFTEHSGCPVIEGEKKIVTQWVRLGVDDENPWDSFNTCECCYFVIFHADSGISCLSYFCAILNFSLKCLFYLFWSSKQILYALLLISVGVKYSDADEQ